MSDHVEFKIDGADIVFESAGDNAVALFDDFLEAVKGKGYDIENMKSDIQEVRFETSAFATGNFEDLDTGSNILNIEFDDDEATKICEQFGFESLQENSDVLKQELLEGPKEETEPSPEEKHIPKLQEDGHTYAVLEWVAELDDYITVAQMRDQAPNEIANLSNLSSVMWDLADRGLVHKQDGNGNINSYKVTSKGRKALEVV